MIDIGRSGRTKQPKI